ncbi:YjbH domain-containing protein [Thioalkalivibrio sp. ALE30]|uniref:YjbH domain-containing protein n=1 Tax=Thioalkalivibrio sp. ALE30 TaxID=1158181 RepID=UPI00036EE988|nr:YjbH domain-containing protein [Thioalkalivibrio sp. ALE30]
MNPPALPQRRRSLVVAVLIGLGIPAAQADDFGLGQGQRDTGGIGLLQTPTARTGDAGHFAAGWNRTFPYRRWSVFVQPMDWMELGFRYVQVENRPYLAAGDDDRYNIDKGADLKLRLKQETRYIPEIAVGFQDLGGTTLFGGEYLVANKRWNNLDFSLGLGWGYLGNHGDIESPLGWIHDSFDTRPRSAGGGQGGQVATHQMFRGPAAVFGGVEYQTPWDRLLLQVEYEGNTYQHEPQSNAQEQDSRFNFGARLRLTRNVELHAGWERGNTAMVGLHFTTNLARLSQPKADDPAPVEPAHLERRDWDAVAADLNANAGIHVTEIRQVGDTLRVTGQPSRFRDLKQSEGRANRLLEAQADAGIHTFQYRWQTLGLDLRESLHDREAFGRALASADHEIDYRHGVRVRDAKPSDHERGDVLYEAEPRRFEWGMGPSLEQNFGGPDGYLYRLSAYLDASYFLSQGTWISSMLSTTLLDNLENYDYIADSELPRVRTHIGDYLAETDVGISNLQATHTQRLGQDWYAMGYGGLLETMYAGIGGEVLYRPFNSRWAVGLDANWVRQRAFDQQFGLRDYEQVTGHVTSYLDTGVQDIHARVSVGRYLAGDIGTTLDFSREFDNGVVVGAWSTFTDAGDDFGEGSFDKGLYLSVPYDSFFSTSSRNRANIAWQPLTRDGGARLNRRHQLFDITEERQLGRYWDDPDATWR